VVIVATLLLLLAPGAYATTTCTDGTAENVRVISKTSGNLYSFTTLADYERFGGAMAPLGDFDGDGVVDIVVGAPADDDGGTDAGSVYLLYLQTNGNVKDAQKISMLYGNFSAFYSLIAYDNFGFAIANMGDVDGNGVVDLAVGAYGDDNGGDNAGAVYVLTLDTTVNVKNAQKISAQYGYISPFYVIEVDDRFGWAVSAPGDVNDDGTLDLVVGALGDEDGGSNCGAVYMLLLQSDGAVKNAQKYSNFFGNIKSFFTLGSNYFGFSVAALDDLDSNGVVDLVVGAIDDHDGGNYVGAVYILFLESSFTVKDTQKISMLEGNLNSLFTFDVFTNFGSAVGVMGDLNGDGVKDIAVGAYKADDGGTEAGEVFILFLETDGTVKGGQKLSELYGNFGNFYNLADGALFGSSLTAVGDLDGDGITHLAVGAYHAPDGGTQVGAVFIIKLAEAACDPSSSGWCYHHTSTVTRLGNNGQGTVQVAMTEVKEGDRILALDHHARPTFAKVAEVLHGPAAEPFMQVTMADSAKHELKATLHHTFDSCVTKQQSSQAADASFSANVIHAKDLKAGDCLHTAEGKATVHSVKHIEPTAGDFVYSIKFFGNIGTVAVGGVFTHAMGHVPLLGGRKIGANGNFQNKVSSKKILEVNKNLLRLPKAHNK